MANDLSLSLRLYADAVRYVSGLTQAESKTRQFASGVKGEFAALKGAMGSLQGQLAALGLSVGAAAAVSQSAEMDKSMIQIGRTAGASKEEIESVRQEMLRMATETGQSLDDMMGGLNRAVAAGLNFGQALPVVDATNKAVAMTSASAETLTGALTVAGQAFQFDLEKPGMAVNLLDKMIAAGDLGNAELENLSAIFSRVGVSASSAGMDINKTLGFIEGMSQMEMEPRKLATLVDSTMRLFNSQKEMETATAATGVHFFDKDHQRRDPVAILKDFKKIYDSIKTDEGRNLFLDDVFGKTDQGTKKGIQIMLTGDRLEDVERFTKRIDASAGALDRGFQNAIDNAVDQTGRLKNALRKAADDFSRPVNAALSGVIRKAMDKKENGGMELDGRDMLVGGALGAAGLFGAARYGGKAIKALSGRFGGTAAGIAEGKAVEAAAGVTPVFVVNWPGGGIADLAGSGVGGAAGSAAGSAAKVAGRAKSLAVLAGGLPLSAWGTSGAVALGTASAGVLAAGAGGYAVGTGINWAGEKLAKGSRMEGVGTDVIGGAIARVLAVFGNDQARQSIALTEKIRETEIGGKISIEVNDGRVSSVRAVTGNPFVPLEVDTGFMRLSN
jgi:TP901 family phage tail tape measure protein